MKKINKSEKLVHMLKYIKKNPKILDHNLRNPGIKLKFSNYQKKYSEFHKIVVKDTENSISKKVYWIKILKNKPNNDIRKSLFKQYRVMESLWHFFNNPANIGKGFSCCEPVALISDFNAHITKECSGTLFNTYLKSNLPFISGKQILKASYRIGKWLNHFHLFYKNNLETIKILGIEDKEFESKKKLETLPKLSYKTICHNDYSPRNIFVTRKSVEVIDYVGVSYGIPQSDIIFFAKYIYEAKFNLMYHKIFKRRMIKKFLEGYGLNNSNGEIAYMEKIFGY